MASNPGKALVCGAGGFIGAHLVRRLKAEGWWVRGVDLKAPPFAPSVADEFLIGDLRDPALVACAVTGMGEVYQLAADMGGAGYVFSGANDADIMHNSALINLNVVEACRRAGVGRVFYSSSACVYPRHNQLLPEAPTTAEDSVYPADPDSDYGWEKLFSERLYLAYARNHGLSVRIARFHNIFGPEGSWDDGREKAPAAVCRKVAEAAPGGSIELWGDGEQTRSFLYIDECLEAVRRFMDADFEGPVNIGSAEMVSINQLAAMVMDIAGKPLKIHHIDGPLGVRGRNSDNRLIAARLGWAPSRPLRDGMARTYQWIAAQVAARGAPPSAGATAAEPLRERVEILGSLVDRITPAAAVERIAGWIRNRPARPRQVVVTGFHGIWTGHRDPAFRAILNQADLFCPDGIAPIWLARVRGEPLGPRLPGAELMRLYFDAADRAGWRSFFYGDTEATLAALAARLQRDWPGHRVVGTRSPPFRALSAAEQAADLARINASGADVLWVGLGLPKQERWIHAYLDQLRVPVVIGVGAAFGFLSGRVTRVPAWLGEAGFEWLWRLAMEPRKLWRRDLIDGPRFLYHGLREGLAHRWRRAPGAGQ